MKTIHPQTLDTTGDQAMSLMDESEEQAIDLLLLELGIRLPEIDFTDEESPPPLLVSGVDMAPLSEELNEPRRWPPYS
ncbi:MAG: hypothetical protein ACYC9J_01520 [Sulfuricaulis sp.]